MENAFHLGVWGLSLWALLRLMAAPSDRIRARRAWWLGASGALLLVPGFTRAGKDDRRLVEAADRITRHVAATVPLEHQDNSDLAFLYGTILLFVLDRTGALGWITWAAEPIVSELFSAERLEQHAQSLAESQGLSGSPGRFRLISKRLADNGEVLLTSYRELSKAIREEALLTPAAEWLVDNFHLVESQLSEIRDNLPPTYYRELPKLDGGHLAGLQLHQTPPPSSAIIWPVTERASQR